MIAQESSAPSRLRRTGPGISLFAALTYSAFLVSRWTSAHSGQRVFVSELEAAGQPYGWLFRLADIASGLAVLWMSWLVYATLSDNRRASSAGVLVAVLGLSSVVDGCSTMKCLPSTNIRCASAEHSAGGLAGQLADLHTDSGMAGFLGAAIGAVLVGTILLSHRQWLGCLSIAVGLTIATTGLLDLVVLLAGGDIALIERTRIVLTSAWLVVLGLAVRVPTFIPTRVSGAGRRTRAHT
jgi:hypothetical membrane protein